LEKKIDLEMARSGFYVNSERGHSALGPGTMATGAINNRHLGRGAIFRGVDVRRRAKNGQAVSMQLFPRAPRNLGGVKRD
jgi:hypothetical protein